MIGTVAVLVVLVFIFGPTQSGGKFTEDLNTDILEIPQIEEIPEIPKLCTSVDYCGALSGCAEGYRCVDDGRTCIKDFNC